MSDNDDAKSESRGGDSGSQKSAESRPPSDMRTSVHPHGFVPSRSVRLRLQEKFLKAYETAGVVSDAARVAGIDRRTHQRWMKRFARYREKFAQAQAVADDALLSTARFRAMVGLSRPVLYKGEQVMVPDPKGRKDEKGNVRQVPLVLHEPSDAVLLAMLRARMPEMFVERVMHSGTIRIEAVSELLIGVVQVARQYVPPNLMDEFIEELAHVGTDNAPTLATAELEDPEQGENEEADEPEDGPEEDSGEADADTEDDPAGA